MPPFDIWVISKISKNHLTDASKIGYNTNKHKILLTWVLSNKILIL